jgi:hypothetical protein
MGSVSNYLEFIRVELDLTPKREFLPHDLFYKCTNLQKLLRSESICFKGLIRAKKADFQT